MQEGKEKMELRYCSELRFWSILNLYAFILSISDMINCRLLIILNSNINSFHLTNNNYNIVLLIIAALLLPARLSLGVFPTVTM